MAEQLLLHGLNQKELSITFCHFGQTRATLETNPNFKKLESYYHFPGAGRISTFFWSAILVPLIAWKKKPQLIINMQVTSGLGTFFWNRVKGVPYIIIGLGLEVLPSSFIPYNMMRKAILKNASKVISISHFTDALVSEYDVSNTNRRIISLGTNPEEFYPRNLKKRDLFPWLADENIFVCFSLCRLVKRKGMDTVIRAMEELKTENIIYVIGGNGPDEIRLKTLVKQLDLDEKVFFIGAVEQSKLADYYSAADLFVHPSRRYDNPPEVEGFGIVFLEAGACETPSIGSYSGGIPDAVIDGKTGLLIQPEDYKDLGEKILDLYKNPEKLRLMGANARRHVLQKANWKSVSQEYWGQFITEIR